MILLLPTSTATFRSPLLKLNELKLSEVRLQPNTGPDATGGVINIITKTFSKNPQPDRLKANAKLHIGQYKFINSDGGFFYGTDVYRISGGALLNKSDGNPLSSGLNGYFNINTVSLSGQFKFNPKWSVSYRYARDYRDFNAQWYYTTSPVDSSNEKVTRNQHQIQLSRCSEKSSTAISSCYLNTGDLYNFNARYKFLNDTWLSDIKIIQNYVFSKSLKLSGGTEFGRKEIESNNRGNHVLDNYSAFATFSFNPLLNLNLNGGMRAHYNNKFGLFVLPQFSASYRFNKTVLLRSAMGSSVRDPILQNYTTIII